MTLCPVTFRPVTFCSETFCPVTFCPVIFCPFTFYLYQYTESSGCVSKPHCCSHRLSCTFNNFEWKKPIKISRTYSADKISNMKHLNFTGVKTKNFLKLLVPRANQKQQFYPLGCLPCFFEANGWTTEHHNPWNYLLLKHRKC